MLQGQSWVDCNILRSSHTCCAPFQAAVLTLLASQLRVGAALGTRKPESGHPRETHRDLDAGEVTTHLGVNIMMSQAGGWTIGVS